MEALQPAAAFVGNTTGMTRRMSGLRVEWMGASQSGDWEVEGGQPLY
jgi:hypothetical protein